MLNKNLDIQKNTWVLLRTKQQGLQRNFKHKKQTEGECVRDVR